MQNKTLGLPQGILIGLGSLIGSGIVFLPEKIDAVAGRSSVFVWLGATAICLAFVPLFRALISEVDLSSGLAAILKDGPLRSVRFSVAYLVLGTVVFGMPISAILIAEVFVKAAALSPMIEWALAPSLICVGFFSARSSGCLNKMVIIMAISFISLAVIVFALTTAKAAVNYPEILYHFPDSGTLGGIVFAFWAFSGFENLLFMSDKFRDPVRDIPKAMFWALLIASVVYMSIQLNFSALKVFHLNKDALLPTTGLLFLASNQNAIEFLPAIVGALSVAALLFNFVSWYSGISSLIAHAINDGELIVFGNTRVANISLVLMQVAITLACIRYRFLIDTLLKQVSVNFIFIYILLTLTFIERIYKRFSLTNVIGATIGILLIGLVVAQPWYAIYPVVLFFVLHPATKRELP